MKSVLLAIVMLVVGLVGVAAPVNAQNYYPPPEEWGSISGFTAALNKNISGFDPNSGDPAVADMCSSIQNNIRFNAGGCSTDPVTGELLPSYGILGFQGRVVASLYQQQPSSREYIADLIDNIGLPQVSSAYAQGTGYEAMNPFLPLWKAFRDFAYSLYIIMFIVVGVMIMLRTKVNAQTVITIQAALPNLIVTLLLITFSYAIVGFMIDLMYFLIYFLVYLVNAIGLINAPTQAIDRLLSYSAVSVIFESRDSIIRAIGVAITEIMTGLGTGALEVAGTVLSIVSFPTLIVGVAFVIAMLKLMFVLIKSYVMLIIQTITAPVQILFNALPGSKAFSGWLKKTASHLVAFPVAAGMFILAAIFVGDPTDSLIFEWGGTTNPFGIDGGHEFYSTTQDSLWLPPFTLTGSIEFTQGDVMVLIGFFIFMMTPAAVKMAQDWLEVKESPYSAEAFANIGIGTKGGMLPASWLWKTTQEEMAARRSAAHLGKAIGRSESPVVKEKPI